MTLESGLPNGTAFLTGGGELSRLIAEFDWGSTSLGPIAGWSATVIATVGLLVRSPVPIVTLWGEDGIMIYNDAYSLFAGGRHPRLLGSKVREGWPEVADFNDHVMKVGLAGRTLAYQDQELTLYRHGQPEQVWMNLDYSPISGADGEPIGVIAIVVETTAKVKAERHLAGERERLRMMFEQAPGFMAMLVGPDHVFDLANPAFLQLIGHREVIGLPVQEAVPEIGRQGFVDLLDRVYRTGEAFVGSSLPVALQRRPGGPAELRYVDLVYQPVRDAAGAVLGIFAQGADVTDRIAAEASARSSAAELRSFAEAMPNHFWTAQPDGRLDWFNERVYSYSGKTPGSLDGRGWADIVHPDDVEPTLVNWRDSLASGASYEAEFRLRRGDGLYRWHIGRAVPVRGADGVILKWVGTNTDIEDQKMTAQALAHLNDTLEARVAEEIAERQQTEAVLAQAQKMEAVGQLTGGLAHDFNNLLTGIIGSLQLLESRLAQGRLSELGKYVNAAQGAAKRAAALTHRLLAFSRRQTLDPRPVDMNRLVAGMEELIRRTIGPEIELEVVGAGGLWMTFVDANQLENALLNLCINARDAMPKGGRLTIETGNRWLDPRAARERDLQPGQYLSLCVSDTGAGMTPEIAARAFDPFFTTKPLGMGTGLGLSMVYGFARQSGGQVRIYSEAGQGAMVCIYLPRFTGDAAQEPDIRVSDPEAASATGETVLVVDDEPSVRMLVTDVLSEAGYGSLEAADGPQAIRILESAAAIDLMVTDVGLPGGLNGRQLADAARVLRPELKVLFMTGYAENAVIGNGQLDPGMEIITKPFEMDEVLRRIRTLIAAE